MPGPPPHPSERTLLHRKVHMRLAATGLSAAHISGPLFADKAEAYRSSQFVRLLRNPHRCTAEMRAQLERLLLLPEGALLDEFPLAAVGAVPVPSELLADEAKGPDGKGGGINSRVAHDLDAVTTYLGRKMPTDIDPAVRL